MLKFAFDKNGELIPAEKAISGIPYYSQERNMAVHVQTSCRGLKYYAAYPESNKDKEHRGNKTSKNMQSAQMTKPEDLLKNILTRPQGGGGGEGGGTHGEKNPEISPIKTLRQAVIMLAPLPSVTSMDGGVVRDVIIADNAARSLLGYGADIGPRIIGLEPTYIDYKYRQVWGRVFWCDNSSGTNHNHTVYLVVQAKNDKQYKQLIRRITGYDKVGKNAIAYKRIWVCGNWHHVIHDICTAICIANNCGYNWKCCGMLMCDYYSNRQLFMMPSDRIAGID